MTEAPIIERRGRVEATLLLNRFDTSISTSVPKLHAVVRHGIKGDRQTRGRRECLLDRLHSCRRYRHRSTAGHSFIRPLTPSIRKGFSLDETQKFVHSRRATSARRPS